MSTIKSTNIEDRTSGDSALMLDAVKGSAKAWVNFNGGGTVAIREDYNVDSITDNGTGDYTVNFTNNLIDTNYALSGSYGFNSIAANTSSVRPRLDSDRLVGSVRIYTTSVAGGAAALGDPTTCAVVISR